ncbi:trypsin-like serine protease [Streptomyces sp. MAR4 CNX-425]|uniref:trypsin-like serine protease n=1 Tax=Streptomyces sp. MAR4 CNX-425 TaxID=3406343 RepID=UPI003B5024DC
MNRHRQIRRALPAALTAAVLAAPPALTAAPAQAVVGTPDTSYAFTAQLTVGHYERGCSGVLVDAEWLLTAASCFVDDPAAGLAVPPGKPALRTVATVGRTDPATRSGQTRTVVELVPRDDRDAVLARLSRPVTGITPVAIGATPPAAGEELRVAGYGRTADTWAPEKPHAGTFDVDSVNGSDVGLSGRDGAAVCRGDTGGPALRATGTGVELVALSSRSFQVGCYGTETPDGTPNTAVGTRVDDLRTWVDATLDEPRGNDFNCDGTEDVAVADPLATVAGRAGAGLVRVVYGGGKGTAEITQDLADAAGGAEANDRFGHALAGYDRDEDGCTDLVVGAPYEDVGGAADAGAVSVLYGAPDGLAAGRAPAGYAQGDGPGDIGTEASEAGDRMGAALAAGQTVTGEPYLVVGVPGEDIGSAVDAGSVFYLRGTVSRAVDQFDPGMAGDPENGDDFGATLAATPQHIAVGVPGEALGSRADAGGVQIMEHALTTAGTPKATAVVNQDHAMFGGNTAEPGDRFSEGLAAAGYRPAGSAAATESVISLGVPGEDTTVDGAAASDAGWVANIRVTGDGAVGLVNVMMQGYGGTAGGPETGDRFGAELAAANVRPRAAGDSAALVLAVGVPGENLTGLPDAGAVQTFSHLQASPGASSLWIQEGNTTGMPGSLAADHRLGAHLDAGGRHLYIGMPYGPSPYGAAHAMPWANARGWPGQSAVTSHEPGRNGLPAAGTRFGSTVE